MERQSRTFCMRDRSTRSLTVCAPRNQSMCLYTLSLQSVPSDRGTIFVFSPRTKRRVSLGDAKRQRPPSLAHSPLSFLSHCKTYTAIMGHQDKLRWSQCLTTHVVGYPPVSHPPRPTLHRSASQRRIFVHLTPVLRCARSLLHPKKNAQRCERHE